MFFDKISSFTDSSKLFLYSKIKKEFKIEEYLLATSNIEVRKLLTKFRVSDHPLAIETGRYNLTFCRIRKEILGLWDWRRLEYIPRENRLCSTCSKIEDEFHFFIECVQNKTLREQLFF